MSTGLVNVNDDALAGYRWIKFSPDLTESHGWDLAWDLDKPLKIADRPNVPRVLPAIRLRSDGKPALEHDGSLDRKAKTIASIYLESKSLIYRLSFVSPHPERNEFYLITSHRFTGLCGLEISGPIHTWQMESLSQAFKVFARETPFGNPLVMAELRLAGAESPQAANRARALIYEGYGTWQ